MQDAHEDAQQPRRGISISMPLVGERLAAMGGGGEAATADSSPAALNVARGELGGAEVAFGFESRRPLASPPLVAAPAVTDEQRQRLRRAIAAYRAEA